MYYPKNKIQTNLYTSGDRYVFLDTKQPYQGYYYKTYRGQFFSGKSPSDISSKELIELTSEIQEPTTINQTPITEYTNFIPNIKSFGSKQLPYTVQITPTEQDYQKGNFIRMFARKTNEAKFYQIDKNQFEKLVAKDSQWDWSFYTPFSLTWVLSGDEISVSSVNKNTVDRIQRELKVFGFQQYIELNGGYNKFYKK